MALIKLREYRIKFLLVVLDDNCVFAHGDVLAGYKPLSASYNPLERDSPTVRGGMSWKATGGNAPRPPDMIPRLFATLVTYKLAAQESCFAPALRSTLA